MVKKSMKTVKMSLCSLSLWVLLLQLLLLSLLVAESSSLIDQAEDDSGSDDEASIRTDKSLNENAKQVLKLLTNEGPAAPEMMKDVLTAKFNLDLDDNVRKVQSAYKRHNQRCEVTPEEHEQITQEITSELKLMNESLEIFENKLTKSKVEMNEIDDGFKVKLETLKKDIAYYLKRNYCHACYAVCCVLRDIKEVNKIFSQDDDDDYDPDKCTPLTPESSDPEPRKMPFFSWFSSVSSKTRDAIKKFLNLDNDGKDSKMNSDNLNEEDGGGRNTSKVLPFAIAGSTIALATLLGYILHSKQMQKQDKRNKLADLLKLNNSSLPPPMPPQNQQNPLILDLTTQDSNLNLWNFLLGTFMILLVVAALVFYFLFYKKKRKPKPMKHKLESSKIGSKRSSENSSGNKSSVSSQKTKKSKSSSKRSSLNTSRKKTPKSKIKK